MAQMPQWFRQLVWSPPTHIAALNQNRGLIPDHPGLYLFIEGSGHIHVGQVLYVGEATASLRRRMANYLVDYRIPKARDGHKGKGFVLEARSILGDHHVYARWVEYGASASDIHILEASLIAFLNPRANDREESARHPLLGDKDRLDARLLM